MAEYGTAAEPVSDMNTNDALEPGQKNVITYLLKKIAAKQPAVRRYENYYRGRHPLNFASEKFTTEFADRLAKFADNLCPTCVQAPADRLEVIGFSADKKSQVYKDSWDIWKYSQMPRFSRYVHRDAFKTGDAFVIVWKDESGRARLWQQEPANCTVIYDTETATVETGAKLWKGLDKLIYLTVYYRDRIEKYVTRNPQSDGNMPTTGAAFVRRSVDGEEWPVANPTGVCPMIHFGRESSILDDVIPLNDALNKSIADMLVGSESNSLMKRFVTGLSYELNPETGEQVIPFKTFSTWVASEDAAAKFGSFPELDLGKFLETIKDFRGEVASVAGIPSYYFQHEKVNLPSGEALRKLESRFTSLISGAQLDFGEPWAAAMKLALAIDGKELAPIDDVEASKGSQLETAWKPADALSGPELVDMAGKKLNVGVSKERALSEIGYTDDDIVQMQQQNADAAKANADTFSKVFDAGSTLAAGGK
jgi:hypothetical protein